MNSLSPFVRILWLAICVALAGYLLLTLWLGALGLIYPYQLDYGEGIVLWFARELASGHTIYKGLAGFPYASSNYPPLAMLLSALMMPIFGEGYTAGRLLNFASALVVAALIYRIVRGETSDWRPAALAALFFVGSPYVYHWAPLFRADLIGLAFAVLGLYFVWRWQIQQTNIYFILFTIVFLLSLYTKQTLVAAPAAAFLAIFSRNRRSAILFALVLGVTGGAIYLAMDSATHGGFTAGLIDSNATVFLPGQLFDLLRNFVFSFAILVGLALWEWLQRVRAKRFGVLEAYALTSLASLVMAGRVGAWENYFFEAIAITCVLAGLRLNTLITHSGRRNPDTVSRLPSLALPALLLVQLALYIPDHDPRIAANLIAHGYPANQQLAGLLARTDGMVISEDMGALVTSGSQVVYYTFQYSSLARSGKWDQSWELNGLGNGLFPLVILEHGTRQDVDHYRRFTREFVSALDRNYARTQTIGKYEIYTPTPLAHLQAADFGDAIAMVGWTAQPETLKPSNLKLVIVWQAKRVIARRYTAFVHLEKADGERVTQDDHEPSMGDYPTTRWAAGEMVREVYTLTIPDNLPAAPLVLRVGWYDTESGDRLSVQASADDTVVIMQYEVR